MTAKPHRCPVCGGRGTVASTFYETEETRRQTSLASYQVACRSCSGRGLVWREDTPEPDYPPVLLGVPPAPTD